MKNKKIKASKYFFFQFI